MQTKLTHAMMFHPAQNGSNLHLHLDSPCRQECLDTKLNSNVQLHGLQQIMLQLLQGV